MHMIVSLSVGPVISYPVMFLSGPMEGYDLTGWRVGHLEFMRDNT